MKLAQRVEAIKPSATLTINAKAAALRAQGRHVISFGVGEPDFDTAHSIQQMAIQAIYRGQTRYTPVGGIPQLKQAVLDNVASDYGLQYRPEQVLVSCGGKHVLYNLFQALLDPGDELLIPAPYWVSYPDMATLAGARPVFVNCREEDDFKLTAETLEAAITAKTRMIIVNSPSNPTGAHYSRAELESLAEVLNRHEQITIISDDIYNRILFPGHEWVNLAMLDESLRARTIIVNGVSKTYAMTGWRIGYAVGDGEVIRAATKIQGQSTSNPCSISQWAALSALSGDQTYIAAMVNVFEQRCRYVLKRLRKLEGVTCPQPAGAFYVFPNMSCYYGTSDQQFTITSSLDLAAYLMETAHVAVVPGSAFGEDRCIRFSYAMSMDEIEEGFDRIEQALGRLA